MNILSRSALNLNHGLPYFEIPGMGRTESICCAFLTRRGGVSAPPFDELNVGLTGGDRETDVHRNRELISANFGSDPGRLLLLRQVHQDGILILKDPSLPPVSPLEGDAVITDCPNLFLGIQTADCLPILIRDRRKNVIAAVHAGRSGTALRITAKVLKAMVSEFGSSPADIHIALGPSVGVCCYEIDERVFRGEWEPFSVSVAPGKWKIDLAGINLAQIREAGIHDDQVTRIDLCTCCHRDLFFSYRAESRTGRQLSLIGISDPCKVDFEDEMD